MEAEPKQWNISNKVWQLTGKSLTYWLRWWKLPRLFCVIMSRFPKYFKNNLNVCFFVLYLKVFWFVGARWFYNLPYLLVLTTQNFRKGTLEARRHHEGRGVNACLSLHKAPDFAPIKDKVIGVHWASSNVNHVLEKTSKERNVYCIQFEMPNK